MELLPANPNKPKHQETFVFECLSSRAEASGKFCFIDYIFQIWKRSLRTRHGNNSASHWPTRQRVSALEGAGGFLPSSPQTSSSEAPGSACRSCSLLVFPEIPDDLSIRECEE